MNRFVIMTVGVTHSGKTTFANRLAHELEDCIVIDQDNHALFINEHYKKLLPTVGPNDLKFAVTSTIIDYAINKTSLHLIVANSNLNKTSRTNLLNMYSQNGFKTILVHFDYSLHTLQERIQNSSRSTSIFRHAKTFDEVLQQQHNKLTHGMFEQPSYDEADYFFTVNETMVTDRIIADIIFKITSTQAHISKNN